MASPAVRSLLGKSKLPLSLLIRGTTLTSPQSKADVGTACFPKVVVPPPPPQSSVFLGKEFELLLGGRKAWALERIGVVNGREDGLRLGGRRPAVKDEEEEVDEDDFDNDEDDLKDLDDSEDFDNDEDDFEDEDEDEVPRHKSKRDDRFLFMFSD